MKTQKQSKNVKRAKVESHPARDAKSEPTKPESLPVQSVNLEALAAPHLTHLENPPPDYLLAEAMKEPDRRLLEEYDQVIKTLRNEKRFTFREIAEWLIQYGVEVDHNAVYRQYTKGLSLEEERTVEMQDAEEEHETR